MKTAYALAAAVLLAAPLQGQSLYNASGLGTPIESLDGRARALGNLGIGLWGGGIVPSDPAAAASLRIPTGIIVGQPSWVDYERSAGGSGSFQGNRFPLMGIAYPAFSGTATVTLGSFLDQRFEGGRDVTYDLLDGSSTARDEFSQEGAVSDIRVGYARQIAGFSVGVSVGRYAGSVLRTLIRDFDDLGVVEVLDDYQVIGRWRYSGTSVTTGVSGEIAGVLRLASSATFSGTLSAESTQDDESLDRSFSMPTQLRFGASAILSEGLLLTASAARADWDGIGAELAGAQTIGGTGGYGVGLELSRARLLGLAAPLRFGYRSTDLPFGYGTSVATESAWSAGLGLNLSETNGIVFATTDLAVERGTRSDSVLKESFWRATISLRIAGF